MSDIPPHSIHPSVDPAQSAPPRVSALSGNENFAPAGANGAPPRMDPPTVRPASPTNAGLSLGEWLVVKGMYLGILLGLWAVAILILKLYGLPTSSAVGFSTIFAAVAAFFVRSLFPFPAEKVAVAAQPAQAADSFREVVETVVFVVVLVLMLKSFAAEAFVIPTGSMAQTLWGYQKVVKCPQCHYEFPVNCSSEVDPTDSPPSHVYGCTCPNCRQGIYFPDDKHPQPSGTISIPDPGWNSGDRVLVAKFVYDLLNKLPDRLDVVVFKFPGDADFPTRSGPVKKHVPMNYIKRLIGLPGETIAIHQGKLYVLAADKGLSYDDVKEANGDPNQLAMLWRAEHMHKDDPEARARWDKHEFEIIRKKPDTLLAMMRVVYDNDHPAQDLVGPEYQRWLPADKSGWSASGKTAFQHDGSGDGLTWLHYRHILRGEPSKPQLITDFMGYNTWEPHPQPHENWASDLIVECEAKIDKPQGEFALEISRGPDRFQTRFDLAAGTCTLFRLVKGKKPQELASKPTNMKGKGTYQVRFANVDDRLAVWVDERLVFGDGVPYPMPKDSELAPVKENDLDRPVSVGAQGAGVVVGKLKVFRDTYYTTNRNGRPDTADVEGFKADDPETWKQLANAPVATYYVQPNHFLCLGDNSPESSDGRSWGLVPRRLLLGRALLVYYPFTRAGRIR